MGGGGGDTYNREYDERMAGIGEGYLNLSTEQQNFWKYGVEYDPYEMTREQIGTENKWVGGAQAAQWGKGGTKWDAAYNLQRQRFPEQSDMQIFQSIGAPPGHELTTDDYGNVTGISGGDAGGGSWQEVPIFGEEKRQGDVRGYDFEGAPSYMKLEQEQTRANIEAMPLETDVYKAELEAKKELIPQYAGALGEFYSEATKEFDPETAALQAKTDVKTAYKGALGGAAQSLARRGQTSLDSGMMISQARQVTLSQAKDEAMAASTARREEEDRKYKRLSGALSVNPIGG